MRSKYRLFLTYSFPVTLVVLLFCAAKKPAQAASIWESGLIKPKPANTVIVEPGPIKPKPKTTSIWENGLISPRPWNGSIWEDGFTKLKDFSDTLHLSGYLKNETAYRFKEPRSFTKMRNIVYLKGRYAINDTYEIGASAWAYVDSVYQFFDYDTITARAERDSLQPLNFIEGLQEEKDSSVATFRELYLDVFGDNYDLRLGKQYIIWGVLTGVRIVDEINPMNFRELILPDLIDYRIPLWSAKLDYYGDSTNYQLIFIPELKFHRPAPSGSEWELLQTVPGTTYPENYKLENSELGFKIQKTILDTDLTLSYFYTWDDFPVVFRHILIDNPDLTGLNPFTPKYTRIHILGSTFQRPFYGQVIKGEFAYVKDKYFGLGIVDRDNDGFIDNLGELRRNHIRWGVGLDFSLWKTDFSPGIMQWIILNYDKALIQDKFDTSFNLFVRHPMPEDNAVFTLLAIVLFNQQEVYLKPKVTFDVTGHVQVSTGFDLFYGKRSQLGVGTRNGKATDIFAITQQFQFIGNFRDNDRLFMEFKYTF